MSFVGSDSDDEDFSTELAAIKAGQHGDIFTNASRRKDDAVSKKPINTFKTSKLAKKEIEESTHTAKVTAFEMDATEREKLMSEISSLVKQVEHFRAERDKAVKALKDMQSKDKKQLESMTEAVKKAGTEALASKKLIYTKDREMATILNKLNSLEIENRRLKQFNVRKSAMDSSKVAAEESSGQNFAFREAQELRATLDSCRVDIAESRKKLVEEGALRARADTIARDMETRAIRAEQMTVAQEKLLNETEAKSAAHIAKLYEDLKVLRIGLVDLNSDLVSQASRGQLELSEMERERRVISTKLDVLLQENRMLLDQCAHQDRSLANQSALLGNLSAHVHQPPIGSPHREMRLEDKRKESHSVRSHSPLRDGELSPTAKRGLLLPMMEEKENTQDHQELIHVKKVLSKAESELKKSQFALKECQEQKQHLQSEIQRMKAPGLGSPKASHEKHHQQHLAKLQQGHSQETAASASHIHTLNGTIEFLQAENRKLTQQLQRGDGINRARSPGPSHVDASPQKQDDLELREGYALARLQVKALRANLILVNRELAKLKAQKGDALDTIASSPVSSQKQPDTAGSETRKRKSSAWSRSPPNQVVAPRASIELETYDNDSVQGIYPTPTSSETGSINLSAIGSGHYPMSRDFTNHSTAAEQRVLMASLNAAADRNNVKTADNGENEHIIEGVSATMADVLRLQRALDAARRMISGLEAKLAKAEYRYNSVNKLLQEIPSTLNVAQAEKRVLEAKLHKQLEIHNFAIAAVRADAQKDLTALQNLLNAETTEKRVLSDQMRQQAEMVASLNARLDKQQQDLVHQRVQQSTMSSAAFIEQAALPLYPMHGQGSIAHTLTPIHPHAAFNVPHAEQQPHLQTVRVRDVEPLSSPVKRLPTSSFASVSRDPNPLPPFQILAYDHNADSIYTANQENFNRLQQAMLSLMN